MVPSYHATRHASATRHIVATERKHYYISAYAGHAVSHYITAIEETFSDN